ncbi:MAG: Unknown protein [uncultured Campylobacterales bacterium]|uniref:Uncharacterized protein n=1 Tax=uncultured Campylobacterales bacterium TaxID=352960 RepID=A0A6S6STF8_9BACT|nr:MAG: Unknown protein [uncultured Campylobacterales bacterium]
MKKILLILLSFSFIYASSDYLDIINENMANRIIRYSKNIDKALCLRSIREEFSEIFNDDYYYKNNKSYLKLILGFQKQEHTKINVIEKIRVRLDLPLLKHSFKLFIDSDYLDNKLDAEYEQDTSLGIESSFSKYLDSKLRLGLRGIDNIYLGYRIGMTYEHDSFVIEPYQYIRYSIEDKLEESTNLNIDMFLQDDDILRLYMRRYSDDDSSHDSYGTSLTYFKHLDNKKIITTSISANISSDENKNYIISSQYQQNIFKKYMFLRVVPYMIWEEINDYKHDLGITVLFEWRFRK